MTIAGCGLAAGLLALRALQFGLAPTLLRTPAPRAVGGVEIIPASTAALFDALDLGPVLAGLGTGLSEGLTRRLPDGCCEQHPGRSLHVDRLKLRSAILGEVVRRGALIRDLDALPPVDASAVSVDATGQRAAWSRPVRRRGREVADIFSANTTTLSADGRVALMEQRWAYFAADKTTATVGVVGDLGRRRNKLADDVRAALGLSPDTRFEFLGRRPAFVQWSTAIEGWRLAVGDAAVHHSPIGGRGVSFALGSAFAAAAVLTTWRDRPQDAELARSYYRDYVAAEVSRHLAYLDRDEADSPTAISVPESVRWTSVSVPSALVADGLIVAGQVFLSATGIQVRWAGGFDLQRLRALSDGGVKSALLATRLQAEGLTPGEARNLIEWALGKDLLGPAVAD